VSRHLVISRAQQSKEAAVRHGPQDEHVMAEKKAHLVTDGTPRLGKAAAKCRTVLPSKSDTTAPIEADLSLKSACSRKRSEAAEASSTASQTGKAEPAASRGYRQKGTAEGTSPM